MIHAGIDVSKGDLHVAVHDGRYSSFPNTPSGHRRIAEWLRGHTAEGDCVRVILEPTARYHLGVAEVLAAESNMEVMLVNPRVAKAFAKARDQRGKSDKVDARMLAAYGVAMGFRAWTPPSAEAKRLRALMRRRAQLVVLRAREKTRAKELRAACQDEFLLGSIDACVTFHTAQIQEIEKQALKVMEATEELRSWRRLLTSIPGVGDVLAMILTAELLALPADMDARQLTAYAGLDPVPDQSGGVDKKRPISRRGNKRLRTALYLAAWTSAKHSEHVRDWKERATARGKPAGVVNVAIARRLLHAIHGMRRTDRPWDGARFNPRLATSGGADA